jgi:hypothetical protein
MDSPSFPPRFAIPDRYSANPLPPSLLQAQQVSNTEVSGLINQVTTQVSHGHNDEAMSTCHKLIGRALRCHQERYKPTTEFIDERLLSIASTFNKDGHADIGKQIEFALLEAAFDCCLNQAMQPAKAIFRAFHEYGKNHLQCHEIAEAWYDFLYVTDRLGCWDIERVSSSDLPIKMLEYLKIEGSGERKIARDLCGQLFWARHLMWLKRSSKTDRPDAYLWELKAARCIQHSHNGGYADATEVFSNPEKTFRPYILSLLYEQDGIYPEDKEQAQHYFEAATKEGDKDALAELAFARAQHAELEYNNSVLSRKFSDLDKRIWKDYEAATKGGRYSQKAECLGYFFRAKNMSNGWWLDFVEKHCQNVEFLMSAFNQNLQDVKDYLQMVMDNTESKNAPFQLAQMAIEEGDEDKALQLLYVAKVREHPKAEKERQVLIAAREARKKGFTQ